MPSVVAPASRIRVERVDDSLAVVAVDGEHDLSTVPELRERLESLIEGEVSVAVDLAHATFVDSSVLAALIAADKLSAERGLGFAVALPPDSAEGVRRVIDVTGLADALTLRESAVDATEAARLEAAG